MTAQSIYSPAGEWRERHYYILKNKTSGKLYVGQTTQSLQHYKGSGIYWINHCKKHGGYSKKNIEVVWYDWFRTEEAAQTFLDKFEEENPGYYLKQNNIWANESVENTLDNPFYGGYIQKQAQLALVEKGEHWTQGEEGSKRASEQNKIRAKKGTNPFTKPEVQSKIQAKRLENQTHNFLGGDVQKAANEKRLSEGTHNFTQKHECPFCGKVGKGPSMFRFHFDKCKEKLAT